MNKKRQRKIFTHLLADSSCAYDRIDRLSHLAFCSADALTTLCESVYDRGRNDSALARQHYCAGPQGIWCHFNPHMLPATLRRFSERPRLDCATMTSVNRFSALISINTSPHRGLTKPRQVLR